MEKRDSQLRFTDVNGYIDDKVYKVEMPLELKGELDEFLKLYNNNETLNGR